MIGATSKVGGLNRCSTRLLCRGTDKWPCSERCICMADASECAILCVSVCVGPLIHINQVEVLCTLTIGTACRTFTPAGAVMRRWKVTLSNVYISTYVYLSVLNPPRMKVSLAMSYGYGHDHMATVRPCVMLRTPYALLARVACGLHAHAVFQHWHTEV